ncbi:MAG: single-stranded DNA-binding protein [Victivallales bacterium]|nr:single-stranded DNA-binding protein [Victivallales bacterium]
MASLNKVFLMGNLTRTPELRYTPGGSAVCELGLAVNRRYLSNGQEQEETCFVDIVVWGKQAESCSRILEKGAPVLVEGRLHFEQWQERDSGAKRSRLRVVAERVQFLSRGQERSQGDSDGGYAPRGNAPRPQQYPQQNRYPQSAPRQSAPPQSYPEPRPRTPNSDQAPPMPEGAFEVENTEDDIPF